MIPFSNRKRMEGRVAVAVDFEETLSTTIELGPGEYEIVSGMFPTADPRPQPTGAEPVELSLSDCQVVADDMEEDTAPRPVQISFGQILALELGRAIPAPASEPEGPLPCEPQQWDLRWRPLPPGVGVDDRRRQTHRTRRARRSMIPLATVLLGVALAGGLLRDAFRAGRLDHVIDVAASFVMR